MPIPNGPVGLGAVLSGPLLTTLAPPMSSHQIAQHHAILQAHAAQAGTSRQKQPEKLGKVRPSLFGDVFFDALACVLLSENLRLREMEIERYELSPDRGRLGVVASDLDGKRWQAFVDYSELDGCGPGDVANKLEERLTVVVKKKAKRRFWFWR